MECPVTICLAAKETKSISINLPVTVKKHGVGLNQLFYSGPYES